MTYYEAFSEARKALNSKEKTGSVGENIIDVYKRQVYRYESNQRQE